MNAFFTAGLITAMILFPAIYFAGMSVITTWAWKYMSRKLLIALAALFGLTVAAWALAFVMVSQNLPAEAALSVCVFMFIASVVLLVCMCLCTSDAIDALKKDAQPVSFSQIVEQALK